jgi:hypothetical protein
MLYRVLLKSPGPRPPYYKLAEHLWGANCIIDSDGDSIPPDIQFWTELTVAPTGPGDPERLDIDPIVDSAGHLSLLIRSASESIAVRAAEYLLQTAGGELRMLSPVEDRAKAFDISI